MEASTSFCKDYDELVMYIVRSASYKEPLITVDLAVEVMQSRRYYCVKKRALWIRVKERMITDQILMISEYEEDVPPVISLHPETLIEEYPDRREQCPWIEDFLGSLVFKKTTHDCMSSIDEYLETYTGSYVLPCLRSPSPRSSSAPGVLPPHQCKEYLDLIHLVVKKALYYSNSQKISEKEPIVTINIGAGWKQKLIERALQRMVLDNVLIPVCQVPEKRTYKLCTFVEAKRFYRRDTPDWLEGEDGQSSWIRLREFLNVKLDGFTQGELIELFGPQAGSRYDTLQAEYKANIKTEVLDGSDSAVLPSIESSYRQHSFAAIRARSNTEKGTRERAWTISSSGSESSSMIHIDIPPRRSTVKSNQTIFNDAPISDANPLGKRKRMQNPTSPPAQPQKFSKTGPVSRTIPDLSAQFENLQHTSRPTAAVSNTIPDLSARFENLSQISEESARPGSKIVKISHPAWKARARKQDVAANSTVPTATDLLKQPSTSKPQPAHQIPHPGPGSSTSRPPSSQSAVSDPHSAHKVGNKVPGYGAHRYPGRSFFQCPTPSVASAAQSQTSAQGLQNYQIHDSSVAGRDPFHRSTASTAGQTPVLGWMNEPRGTNSNGSSSRGHQPPYPHQYGPTAGMSSNMQPVQRNQPAKYRRYQPGGLAALSQTPVRSVQSHSDPPTGYQPYQLNPRLAASIPSILNPIQPQPEARMQFLPGETHEPPNSYAMAIAPPPTPMHPPIQHPQPPVPQLTAAQPQNPYPTTNPLQPPSQEFFTDPRSFYGTYTSRTSFPISIPNQTQLTPSSISMITQLEIQTWFLDPSLSGLQLFINTGCENTAHWNHLESFLIPITGLTRSTLLSHMLVSCQSVLDPTQTKRPVSKAQKYTIGSQAQASLLNMMRVPWRDDVGCRVWLEVALRCYATFAVHSWKLKVGLAAKKGVVYTPRVVEEFVSPAKGGWNAPALQAPPTQLPPNFGPDADVQIPPNPNANLTATAPIPDPAERKKRLAKARVFPTDLPTEEEVQFDHNPKTSLPRKKRNYEWLKPKVVENLKGRGGKGTDGKLGEEKSEKRVKTADALQDRIKKAKERTEKGEGEGEGEDVAEKETESEKTGNGDVDTDTDSDSGSGPGSDIEA
ncbi:hypothetical protein DL98DRAFT_576270 [Cadophora sp. DSE1049]|nr:hypothetical protein DL98DRAFT_576270 [Cadophora sp. DSE1049]